MREPLPLATIHEAVLEFLRGRDDVVVFGATAVNAYVSEPRKIEEIRVPFPPDRIARKVASYHARRGQPKGFSDMRDLAVLFLTFPELKSESGPVLEVLRSIGVRTEVIRTWYELVAQEIRVPDDDSEFD